MGWVRISDDFYDHHKLYGVTVLGDALWIRGLAFCNRNLTNGFIPKRAVKGLIDLTGLSVSLGENVGRDALPDDAVTELVDAGLWHEPGHDCESCDEVPRGQFLVHDYLEYQPSREKVLAERERDRGRKTSKSNSGRIPAGKVSESERPQPQPQPLLTVNRVSQVLNSENGDFDVDVITKSLAGLGVTNFSKIHSEIARVTGRPLDAQAAYQICLDLLSRADGLVKNPQGYLLTAVTNSWAEIQQRIDGGDVA